MRKLILFIAIACFTQIASAQFSPKDDNEPKLKGHVKQVTEYTYHNKLNVDSLGRPYEKVVKCFDEKGNQLSEEIYGSRGDLESKVLFDHSKANTTIYILYGDLMKYISKFDNKGNQIEFSSYPDDSTARGSEPYKFKFIYRYNDKNNLVETDSYSHRNVPDEKTIFNYNESNQLIEKYWTRFLAEGERNEKTILKYSPNGNQIESETFDLNGNLKFSETTTYSSIDDQGNWLTKIFEGEKRTSSGNDSFKDVVKREIIYFE